MVSWEGGGPNQFSYREEILNGIAGGDDLNPRYLWAKDNADAYGVSRNTSQ
jgi:hypothetical protein